MYETNINEDFLCAQWCIANGILRAGGACTTHNSANKLMQRKHKSIGSDQILIRQGTILHQVKLSLGQALMLFLCFAHGLTIEDSRRTLIWSASPEEVAASTVVRWNERLRARIAAHMQSKPPIGGERSIVQIDEALLGRHKYNRGRVVASTWVLGMIADDGSVRFEIINNRKATNLEAVIERNVLRGSIVHTDQWCAHSRLPALGYGHATVNHSERFVSPDGVHTQRI